MFMQVPEAFKVFDPQNIPFSSFSTVNKKDVSPITNVIKF